MGLGQPHYNDQETTFDEEIGIPETQCDTHFLPGESLVLPDLRTQKDNGELNIRTEKRDR